jgi:hypothetical protein
MQALWISRESCREFALRYSWENSARQFIAHARKVAAGTVDDSEAPSYAPETAPDSGAQSLAPDCKARKTHEHSL